VDELKETESKPESDSDNKRIRIIDVESVATFATTTINSEEPDDPKEGGGTYSIHRCG
jgi:hypothetical protein